MSRFDADVITRPGMQERLQGIDPWALQAFLTLETATQLDDFQSSIIDPTSLLLTVPGGENKEFMQPCHTAYSEEGTLIHIRKNVEGYTAVVMAQLGNKGYYSYPDVDVRHEVSPRYGLPSEVQTTSYTIYSPEEPPLLTDAARRVEEDALAYAAKVLERRRGREIITIGTEGWSYKPSGSTMTIRLHDWAHLSHQRELIAARGFVVENQLELAAPVLQLHSHLMDNSMEI